MIFLGLVLALVAALAAPALINFQDLGAIPDDDKYSVALDNAQLLNSTLNAMLPYDILLVPNHTYWLIGGIYVSQLSDVTIRIDGTLSFSSDRDTWPRDEHGDVEECIYMEYLTNVTFTSGDGAHQDGEQIRGTLDGNGLAWWGAIQFLKHQEDRPRLFHMKHTKNILVENLLFKNSPFWTFYAEDCDGLVVRHSDVDVRWTDADYHTLIDLQAFNTDGFDVTGKNVHIHDCNIWNQDDCIAVKDGSQDMLFERISCSGLGLVIGSIGGSQVKNITFRDCVMPNTVKGIYLKTRWSDSAPVGDSASISDIYYENITIDSPQQYAIWIGPAQQTGQPCSLLWPQAKNAECLMSGYQTWKNIVLKDIYIRDPKGSPGVLYGNTSNPITNLVFENVVVENPGSEPWGNEYYFCEGVEASAIGETRPVPTCFELI